MSTTPTARRKLACWADESTQNPETGTYAVHICIEHEPGYWVLNEGWPTLDAAQKYAQESNEIRGMTPDQVLEVRISSLAVSQSEGLRPSTGKSGDADLLLDEAEKEAAIAAVAAKLMGGNDHAAVTHEEVGYRREQD